MTLKDTHSTDLGDDFGQSFWRSAGAAPPLAGHAAIHDAEFRQMAENLPTLCSMCQADGAVIWFNRRWYEYLGIKPSDIKPDFWQSVLDQASLPGWRQSWQTAMARGMPCEIAMMLRGADGVARPFLNRAWPLPGPDGTPHRWFCVAIEIGAQATAEAALRTEALAHAALITAQQRVAAATDLDTMLDAVVQGALSVSPQVDGATIELRDSEGLTCRATSGCAAPRQNERRGLDGTLSALCLAEGRPHIIGDAQADSRTDQQRARLIGGHAMVLVPVFRRDVAVGVLKLISATRDAFTPRDVAVAQLLAGALAAGFADKAEEAAASALRETEARFQVITDAVDPMIWSAAADGRTDFYNARWYDFVGMPKSPTDADLWTAVLHPEDWMRAAGRWSKSVATGEPFEIEYRLRHHSGQYRWALGRATLMRDPSGQPLRWYGTCTDIHDRRTAESALRELNDTLEQRVAEEVAQRAKAEDALRQAQKMDAVGQLTGGIAHDFNNLLTIISGNIDSALRALSKGSEARARRALENATTGAERAAALTQRLLAFARRQPLAPRAIDAGKLVAGMSDLLHRALGETVQLDVGAGEALWAAEADPNQLENAILNLAVNARDAMPDGGRLTITTSNEIISPLRAAQHAGLLAGDYVVISVGDTGTGMTPQVISRAFEPFFTTKEVGRGTGLGLSQVYGFVKQSGGYVMIESEPGAGTTVRICLPRVLREADEDKAAHAPPPQTPARRATILVVEDDDGVRAYTVECLTDLGYHVLQASNGEAGLRLMAEQQTGLDLLFTDVVMPGMSGRELAEIARRRQPDLKVLYTSGYTRDAVLQDRRVEPGVDMIGKPFTYAALAQKLREMLEG